VKFLNEDCSLVHGAVAISSIYVDPAGEWKLFGFEYLCSLTEETPLLIVTCVLSFFFFSAFTPIIILSDYVGTL
jgi:hypothetical protein